MSEIKLNKKVTLENCTKEELITELYSYALQLMKHYNLNEELYIDDITDYILSKADGWVGQPSSTARQHVYRMMRYYLDKSKKFEENDTRIELVPLSCVSYKHTVTYADKLVWKAVSRLSPREQKVIEYRFVDGLTFGQVAEEMGISWAAVKEIEAHAIRRLRHPAVNRMFGVPRYSNRDRYMYGGSILMD